MHINPNIEKPIFIQIAEQLEDSIFTKVFPEETKIPSTNELSSLLNINPHTVLKGMNLLVDEEIIYKKRGLGMFVKKGAVNKILLKRQSQFYEQYVAALIQEASKLHMKKEEIISLIERGFEHEKRIVSAAGSCTGCAGAACAGRGNQDRQRAQLGGLCG